MKKSTCLFFLTLCFVLPLPLFAQDDEKEELPEELLAMFEYDAETPFNSTVVATETRGEVTIHDITYPSPVSGAPIAAYLVVPAGEGPFPAVMYVHWFEPGNPTANRSQFVEEAITLAQEDAVMSLHVETMWSDHTWYRHKRTLESDFADAIHQVIDFRRGLDVLLSQPGVDRERVAFVGHDFGAMYGALLAGVDHRANAYVMIAGASNFNKWMLFGVDPDREGLAAYKAKMDTLAPTLFIPHAQAPVFFQFGTRDFYTPEEDIEAYFAAAVDPKTIKRYDVEHHMEGEQIVADRLAFLREHLGLTEGAAPSHE